VTAVASTATRPPYSLRRAWRERRDVLACLSFAFDGTVPMPFLGRAHLIAQAYAASFAIDSPHRQEEILAFVRTVLALPADVAGVVVEAGCYKGSSTAKFSHAAAAAGRELVVFDSFQGLPANDEPHDRNIFGRPEHFHGGAYRGTLAEVQTAVATFGRPRCCRFVPGWFAETLPAFREPVAAIYLDVDLASSTRECLKHLYPLLNVGGTLFSQDGHLPLVIDVLEDEDFWEREVGCPRPAVEGLGTRKLVRIVKQAASSRGV
jgi:O-methyltransferase